ncbi:unnamed protein product [Cladocopium goreaui]|uniref:DDE-1 domain-containing protein n=1 Tax=Cladocopium goreaui TaxID=2562237 RepID=A0A9P1DDN9_9DINO|nr:unnamed protein product [Cladocopium goreaui]
MSSIELAGLSRRIRSVRRSLRIQLDESQGSWSGLSASCVRQALLVYLWSQAKTSHHALDAAATYLARAAPLVIVQVAVSAKDAFDALFAATSAALMARLSTDPPASELYRACDFIIQYLLHDWVRSQNVEYGVAPTRQQLVRQALLFVPDGLPEAVENRLCLPFYGGPPSQRAYLRRFRKAWNGRIGTLPVTASLPIHVLQEKAYSFYRWANCIPPDNILVNMDECSLAVHVEGCRGTVLRSVRGAVRASLSTQRSRMTLLASVSTDFGFNAILPQVIIANKTQFPIKFMKFLDPAITDRLKIWRGATAWNTAAFMCSYLRLLHENWQSYCPEKPLTLLFDCAACHLHSTVRSLAKTLGLQVLVVPAGATGTLQPLDAYIFRTLRCEIRRQWTQTKSEAAEGVVSREAWLRVMATAVETVLSHRDWQRAFEGTGVTKQQNCISSHALKALQWDECPKIPAGRPSVGQASCIFPSRGAGSGNIEAWVKECAGDVLQAELAELKQRRQELREAFKANKAHMKAAQKRKAKLVKAARQLSVSDLQNLLGSMTAERTE